MSERALLLTELMNDAVDYSGSESLALRWIKADNQVFGSKKPIKLCNTSTGIELVREAINCLRHGMTASTNCAKFSSHAVFAWSVFLTE